MNSMINRQNKTADGLRERLFDTLDALIKNEVSGAKVDSVCMLSDQILKSAKLELEIELEKERIVKDKREFDREDARIARESFLQLSENISEIIVVEDEDD